MRFRGFSFWLVYVFFPPLPFCFVGGWIWCVCVTCCLFLLRSKSRNTCVRQARNYSELERFCPPYYTTAAS